jgi:hypothetical protein
MKYHLGNLLTRFINHSFQDLFDQEVSPFIDGKPIIYPLNSESMVS